MRVGILFIVVVAALSAKSTHAQFSQVTRTISFNEYPFPVSNTTLQGPNGTTNFSYNLINNTTGNLLSSDNGDTIDFTGSYTASAATALSTSSMPNLQWQTTSSGRITSNRGLTGTVASNNPSTRTTTTMTLLFSNQLSVTNMQVSLNGLNTAGVVWETSTIGLLDSNGNFFSPPPVIGSYLTHTSFNDTNTSRLGWVIADSKATVNNVGALQTSAGFSGPFDNVNAFYSDFGLASGTVVTGLVWTMNLDDTRGTLNGTINTTASLTDFTILVSSVPEPGTIALLGLLGSSVVGGYVAYRRNQKIKLESICESEEP